MDATFRDLIDENIVIIYMDNIFIFAKDLETLEENMRKVLHRLQENDLYLKPKKCEFAKVKIEWLGMIIEEQWTGENWKEYETGPLQLQ